MIEQVAKLAEGPLAASFAEISGLNVVIDPRVNGTVDVALKDVRWDQALDIILRANKLGYVVDGTIVRVAPLTVLAEEETQRRKLAEEQALAGELRVLTRSLSYAKAEDLTKLLTATALSQRGSIQVDPRTNTIIINDLAERLERASTLLTTLDRPEPQVEIEARIVQTNREFARRLGVQWGFNARMDQAVGNTTPLAFPNNGALSGRTGAAPPPLATQALRLAGGQVPGAVRVERGQFEFVRLDERADARLGWRGCHGCLQRREGSARSLSRRPSPQFW